MNTQCYMPTLLGIFSDGYGAEVIRALIDSIEAYGVYLSKSQSVASETDSTNIYHLTQLLRAIMADCYGINTQ